MNEPKYKIGQVLKPIIDESNNVRLHVVAITTLEVGTSGKQIGYRCRVYTNQFVGGTPSATKALFGFEEMEVEPHPESNKTSENE